jgi:hypothetical protein
MFWRLNNYQTRVSRVEDEVFVDTVGLSTAWLPVCSGDVVHAMACKAALAATRNPNFFQIKKFREWATGSVTLEQRRGGQDDTEAWVLAEWQDKNTSDRAMIIAPGFVRLNLLAYVPPFAIEGGCDGIVSMGWALRLFISKGGAVGGPHA